jgi:hypothetical protein
MKSQRTHSYGLVLVLVASSIVFQMAAEGSGVIRWITILLQAATLVAAVRAAHPQRAALRAAGLVAAIAALAALVILIATGEIPEGPTAIVSGLLVAVAPAVLVGGLIREVRGQGVTIHTLSGVLSIYLLIGMFFAFVYGAIEAIDNGALFVQVANASPADRLYFSFVTMCTVGYGDLTLGGNLPRSFAVLEMLIGQIYLVTIVALIVSNLARPRQAS